MNPFNWTCPYCGQATTITEPNFSNDLALIDTKESKHYPDQEKLRGSCSIGIVINAIACPNPDCKELELNSSLVIAYYMNGYWQSGEKIQDWVLLPKSCAKPQPEYIPEAIRRDYEEACLILNDSPKASATLSRRCLQGIVRDFWDIPDKKRGNLGAELNSIKDKVASDTWEAVLAIRDTGNIGAHMNKDVNIILDVEKGEAELLIELIETLLEDWYIDRYRRHQRSERTKALAAKKMQERQAAKKASKIAKTSPQINEKEEPSKKQDH